MRRFIAYLALSVLGLTAVGVTFNTAFLKSHTNIEYADGKSLTFQLSSTDDDSVLPEDASSEIASIMEQRLNTYGETRYDIYTQGNDIVEVVLSEEQTAYYEQIETYLSFNGAFALGTSSNTVAIGDEFMDTSRESYVTFVNHYPTVVIPINSESEEFQAVIEEAERLQEEANNNTSSEEEGETTEDTATYVYLAYNFNEETDTISELISSSDDYDEDKADKLLMQFDISRIWSDDTHTAIASSVNIDTDGDGSITTNDVSNGTQIANYYVNLLNSDELPYNVTFIFEKTVPAYFENIISYGMRETVAMSRTLIATLFAILILSLLLTAFYRWAALAIATLGIGSTYLALLFSILFTVEFNTAMVVGLALVAIVSVVCGVVYINKVKEECYRGRSLKKANAEGAKRALLPIVDLNVLLVIIGAIFYWLGGEMMISFAAVCVFGGIASLLLNTLGLKALMWLLTNTTRFTNKYSVIGVKNENVPNILNEEKQSFYGTFQNTNFTKHKKPFMIVGLILFAASIAGSITFGVLDNGTIFNPGTYSQGNTYLYFETTTNNSSVNLSYVENLLKNTQLVYEENEETTYEDLFEEGTNLNEYMTIYSREEVIEGVTTNYTYIVVDLNRPIDGEQIAKLNLDDGYQDTLNNLYVDYIENANVDANAMASVKMTRHVNAQQPDYIWIVVASAVAIGFMSLYLTLRYGLSKGLATVLFSGVIGFISVGVFVLTRISVGLDLFIALPLIIAVSYLLMTLFANKDKEMVKDELVRSKDNSVEKRVEIMNKAVSLSASTIAVAGIIVAYLCLNNFGFGPLATSNYYLFAFVGLIVGLALILTCFGPVYMFIYKIMRKLNIKLPNLKIKRKHKKAPKVKSSEPEEAIFIGIND